MYRYLVIGCVLAIVPLWVYSLVGGIVAGVCIPLLFLLQGALFYRFRRAQPLVVLTLYLFLYFVYLVQHFWGGARLSEWGTYQQTALFNQVLLQFFVFYVGLAAGALQEINPEGHRLIDLQGVRVSQGTALFFTVAMIGIVLLVMRTGTNVLVSDNPYQTYIDNASSSSAVPFFAILCTLCLGVALRPSRLRSAVLYALLGMLFYYMLTRGYRIILTSVCMTGFMLFWERRFSTRTVLLLCGLAVVGFLLLNIAKGGGEFSWGSLFNAGHDGVILSHHADNLYGAACMNGVVADGKVDVIDRMGLALGFLLHGVVPPGMTPDSIRYPHFINLFTITGGGGLAPTACYMFWGYLGCFLFPYLWVRFVARAYQRGWGRFGQLAALVTLCFGCNWLSYDFHVVLRFPIMAICLMWLASKVDMGWLLITDKQLNCGK